LARLLKSNNPKWASSAILKLLDWGACLLPSLSDVIIVKLAPKGS
jgi:hypothetical protein